MPKRKGLLAVVLFGILWVSGVGGAPQRVRLPEGNAHGFLIVRPWPGRRSPMGSWCRNRRVG